MRAWHTGRHVFYLDYLELAVSSYFPFHRPSFCFIWQVSISWQHVWKTLRPPINLMMPAQHTPIIVITKPTKELKVLKKVSVIASELPNSVVGKPQRVVISQIQTPSRSCGTVDWGEIFQDIFRLSTTITIAVGYFHSGWRYSSRIQPHTDSGIETEVVNNTFSIEVFLIPEMIWNQKQQKNVKRKCQDSKESHNVVLAVMATDAREAKCT